MGRTNASAREVFAVFLRLGLTSFGGPVAHLGYFRRELVQRRAWLGDAEYAQLVALCQFLPGPASSQVGFALGLRRAGIAGAAAAFLGFTLPSFVLMLGFAELAPHLSGPAGDGVVAGLKAVAVAVVAQAVWAMSRALSTGWRRAAITVLAAMLALALPGVGGQMAALLAGVLLGLVLLDKDPLTTTPAQPDASSGLVPRSVRASAAVALLAVGAWMLWAALFGAGSGAAVLAVFLRSGGLVFGGGHVVLPLLHGGLVDTGWVGESAFLAGYGAAQALPGPLFTVAAYLGAVANVGPGGLMGALLATLAIFLPGFLLLVIVLPSWARLTASHRAAAMVAGVSAAVVGVLAAAWWSPIVTSSVHDVAHALLAALCLSALVSKRVPVWVVVAIGAAGGAGLGLLA